jgi:hypothetical protein
MTYLSTPLRATGWERTLVNDSEGNTVLLMPNGHKGLEAVKEATALFAAAPEMLAALERAYETFSLWLDIEGWDNSDETAMVQMWAAIAKAKGEVA